MQQRPKSNVLPPIPTLGGRQFWADIHWRRGFRLQKQIWTGHYRVLDHRDLRLCFGSLRKCEKVFFSLAKGKAVADVEHFVVLLHGLGRSRHSMHAMRDELEGLGMCSLDVGYPSTRGSIKEHVQQVQAFLGNLARDVQSGLYGDCEKRISFVTHSLGGIVMREVLALENPPWAESFLPHRLVMLAPPSTGSALAEHWKNRTWFKMLLGPSAQELPPEYADRVAAPTIPFGIVAGVRGEQTVEEHSGWNPLLHGPDDGVVSLAETQLPQMADFLAVPALHTFIMRQPNVIQAVGQFLQTGTFGGEGKG